MAQRTAAPKSVEKEVLIRSRRRCCLCVFLSGRQDVRQGQIAHLSRDPRDSRFENLVFLCLEHHDAFDSRPSQSRGFSAEEVREYRDQLYHLNGSFPEKEEELPLADEVDLEPFADSTEYEELRKQFPEELACISRPWSYPLWQVANRPDFFAYKASNGADGVCLIERIDLPDGRIVIVCIETAGNPGISITNCVEELCFQVCERFEIPPDRLVWLEHYDYPEDDEWSMVTFVRRPPSRPFEDPKWTTMTSELWRGLFLKPKKKLKSWHGNYESKVTKLFHWPDAAI